MIRGSLHRAMSEQCISNDVTSSFRLFEIKQQTMSYGPLVVEIVCIFIVTAFLLNHYGNLRKQRILVTVGAFVAWYFSFMIIFILPLDVTSVSC